MSADGSAAGGASLLGGADPADDKGQAQGQQASTGGTQQAAPSATGGEGQQQPTNAQAWFARFSTGLEPEVAKEWESRAGRYKDEATFARSFVELNKSAVFLPKDGAKDDEWGKVYERLGKPKDPKEYAFNWGKDAPPLQDSEKEAQEGFRQIAHRLHLTQKQIDGLTQWNGEQRKAQYDAFSNAPRIAAERAGKELQSEWGPAMKERLGQASAALRQYGGKEHDDIRNMRLDDGTFLGDNPKFIRMLARIGQERSEDDRDPTEFNRSARESAQEEIKRIEGEAVAKGLNPTHPSWPNDVLDPLYKKAFGSRPVNGQNMHLGA